MRRFAHAFVAAFIIVSVHCQMVRTKGRDFTLGDDRIVFKGTNYYPRTAMWASMWTSWPWDQIINETRLFSTLGINCVRIMVPYTAGEWGGPNVNPKRINQLYTLVNHFGSLGIKSIITLFDWETTFPSAGSQRYADHVQYVTKIVTPFSDNPNVMMWDIKNEPDHPDNIDHHDNWNDVPKKRDIIVNWLYRVILEVRKIDKNHLVSIGLRWWENFVQIYDTVDVAAFHSYWPPAKELADMMNITMRRPIPLLVEEFGWPTAPVGPQYNETLQVEFYKDQMSVYERFKVGGCVQWMAFDAKKYDGSSFENFFGLWRYDMTLKPVADVFMSSFTKKV
jgi:endo-1,4-beta-mannosidase